MATRTSTGSPNWERARLIPVSGISGADEQERRATSALLAVMSSVRSFGQSITVPIGAPRSAVETFTEVQFKLNGKTVIPDGVVRCARGKREWTCLVEVKTGTAPLKVDQIENYLDIAREQGFDCVLTISNDLRRPDGEHPVTVDKRKTKTVALHHLSWSAILTAAIYQHEHIGISDPEQAWILGEFIRYLEHEKSGAREFEDMGQHWVEVREAVSNRVLKARDPETLDVCARWGQLIRFICLVTTRRLGVQVVGGTYGRRPRTDFDLVGTANQLASEGRFAATFGIPNTAGPIDLMVDLHATRIEVGVRIEAPQRGSALKRTQWLLRQLKEAPDDLRIDVWAKSARAPISALLGSVREDPDQLLPAPGKEISSFTISATYKLGTKRNPPQQRGARKAKRARVSSPAFVPSCVGAFEDFYNQVVVGLTPWQAPAPRPSKKTDEEGSAGAAMPEDAGSSGMDQSITPPEQLTPRISPSETTFRFGPAAPAPSTPHVGTFVEPWRQ